MSTPHNGSRKRLPVQPSQENLKKQAKRLAKTEALALAAAQHRLAGEYGCRSWAELMHVVEVMRRGSDQLADVKREVEPLPKAARARDIAAIRRILEAENFTQHDLDAGLAHAAWYGGDAPDVLAARKEIFDTLLDAGADPDGQYGSAYGPIVFGTGECLSPDGLQWLIDAGADVTFGRLETKYGPVCPMDTWLGTYARGQLAQKRRGIDLLLANKAFIPLEVSPPILAIHRGDAKTLGELIDADRSLLRRTFADMPYGNIKLAGATLLHCAVEFGQIECIDAILTRYRHRGDADLNTPAEIIDGVGGQTPLFHAIHSTNSANFAVLEYLIRRNGQYIDPSVRATWRGSAAWAIRDFDPATTPHTAIHYAEIAVSNIDPKNAQYFPRAAEEVELLRSLDRRRVIRAAAARGDTAEVDRLLTAHPDLLTPELWPPAIFQAQSLELTRLLLDRGLDPNQCSAPRKPLHLAADRGLIDILRLLLARGASLDVVDGENITPYELVCCGLANPANVEAVRQLFKDAGAKDTLFTHIYLGHDDQAIALLQEATPLAPSRGPIGFTPLQTAARAARPAVIRALLDLKPDVDFGRPNSALWLACQSNANPADRIEVAALLLAAGANPRRHGENESTPLHLAAWRGPIEMVELLLRHDAKEWMRDTAGKLPRDYASESSAADREAIVHLLTRPVIDDPHFKAAVAALHAGDAKTLAALLRDHPSLIHDTAKEPACYQPGYFRDPKLLWFVANNPNLIETMPANIVELTQILLDAGPDLADINYTIELVMTSDPAAKQGHQRPLMQLLMSRGGTVQPRAIEMTLAHSDVGPVQFLLELGHPITAALAAGLGRIDDLRRLLPGASPAEVQSALSLAVINGHVEAARLCLDAGADVNAFSIVHVHATSAHQAAIRDDIDMLKLLVEHGAKLDVRDKLWNALPLNWAMHEKKSATADYLRSIGAPA